jgi:DNA modification methylase
MNIPPVQLVNVDKIKVDWSNPNEMSNDQFSALKKNIQRYGFLVPVITNKDFLICDGEHRFLAGKELGMSEVPCVVLDVSEVDRRIIRQVMNKLKGSHDVKLDEEEYKYLLVNDSFKDLKELLAMQDKEEVRFLASLRVVDEVPVPIVKEVSVKSGDFFKLGNHYVLCGDATKKEDVELLLNNIKADVLISDPPYGVDYGAKNPFLNYFDKSNRIEADIENDNLKNMEEWNGLWINNIKDKINNTFHIFAAGNKVHYLMNAFEKHNAKISALLVWVKNNHVLGRVDYSFKHEQILYGWFNTHKFYGGFQTSVLNFDKPLLSDLHPTMKPIKLMAEIISHVTQKDSIVLDPFGGSGSTLIAAEQTKRVCYMMEIDPHYVEIICQRFEGLTGVKRVIL